MSTNRSVLRASNRFRGSKVPPTYTVACMVSLNAQKRHRLAVPRFYGIRAEAPETARRGTP